MQKTAARLRAAMPIKSYALGRACYLANCHQTPHTCPSSSCFKPQTWMPLSRRVHMAKCTNKETQRLAIYVRPAIARTMVFLSRFSSNVVLGCVGGCTVPHSSRQQAQLKTECSDPTSAARNAEALLCALHSIINNENACMRQQTRANHKHASAGSQHSLCEIMLVMCPIFVLLRLCQSPLAHASVACISNVM